jgi:hypothetical protein
MFRIRVDVAESKQRVNAGGRSTSRTISGIARYTSTALHPTSLSWATGAFAGK